MSEPFYDMKYFEWRYQKCEEEGKIDGKMAGKKWRWKDHPVLTEGAVQVPGIMHSISHLIAWILRYTLELISNKSKEYHQFQKKLETLDAYINNGDMSLSVSLMCEMLHKLSNFIVKKKKKKMRVSQEM